MVSGGERGGEGVAPTHAGQLLTAREGLRAALEA